MLIDDWWLTIDYDNMNYDSVDCFDKFLPTCVSKLIACVNIDDDDDNVFRSKKLYKICPYCTQSMHKLYTLMMIICWQFFKILLVIMITTSTIFKDCKNHKCLLAITWVLWQIDKSSILDIYYVYIWCVYMMCKR